MEFDVVYLTEEQLDFLILKEVKFAYDLGLKFLDWKVPYKMQVINKKQWLLAKIKYGI